MNNLTSYVFKNIIRRKKDYISLSIVIILCVFLMSFVLVFFSSLLAGDLADSVTLYGDSHLHVLNVNAKEKDEILSNDSILSAVTIEVINSASDPPLTITSLSSIKAIGGPSLLYGESPQDGEIVIPNNMRQGSVNVGSEFPINSHSNNDGKDSTLIVSGLSKPYVYSSKYAIVSDNTFNAMQGERTFDLNIKLKRISDAENLQERWFNTIDYEKSYVAVNNGYIEALSGFDAYVTMRFALITAIVICGVICIFNIANIHVKRRYMEYGILSAIGAEQPQIIKIVLLEIMVVLLFTMPLSILLSLLTSKYIVGYLTFDSGNILNPIFNLNVKTFVVIIIISILTVAISVAIPALRASLIPPISAVNDNFGRKERFGYGENRLLSKPKAIRLKYIITNISRNKAQAFLIVISMSWGVFLFIFFNGFVDLDKQRATMPLEGDFTIRSTLNNSNGQFSQEFLENLETVTGIRKVMYRQSRTLYNVVDSNVQEVDTDHTQEIIASIVDEHNYDDLTKLLVKGNLHDVINSEEQVALLCSESTIDRYQIGDMISCYYSGGSNDSKKPLSLTVGAVLEKSDAYNPPETDGDLSLFLSINHFAKYTDSAPYEQLIIFTHDEYREDVKSMLGRLEADDYSITDELAEHELDSEIARKVTVLPFTLTIIILIVSAIMLATFFKYYINTRTNELGTLKAIGGTEIDICRIVVGEAIIYGIASSAVSIVSGMALLYYCYSKLNVYPANFGWSPSLKIILAGLAANIAIIIMSALLSYISVRKLSIIDAIRHE